MGHPASWCPRPSSFRPTDRGLRLRVGLERWSIRPVGCRPALEGLVWRGAGLCANPDGPPSRVVAALPWLRDTSAAVSQVGAAMSAANSVSVGAGILPGGRVGRL